MGDETNGNRFRPSFNNHPSPQRFWARTLLPGEPSPLLILSLSVRIFPYLSLFGESTGRLSGGAH